MSPLYSTKEDALGWRLDDDDGFACFDGPTKIGRVLPVPPGHPGAGDWGWFAFWFASPNTGREHSRREAMAALERHYLGRVKGAEMIEPFNG